MTTDPLDTDDRPLKIGDKLYLPRAGLNTKGFDDYSSTLIEERRGYYVFRTANDSLTYRWVSEMTKEKIRRVETQQP